MSYSAGTDEGGAQLPLSVAKFNLEPLQHALCTVHSSGFEDPGSVPPTFVGCLVTHEAPHEGRTLLEG